MYRLTRNFSVTGLVGIVLVALALGAFYSNWATNALEKQETEANMALTQALSNTIWPRYANFVEDASQLPANELKYHPVIRQLQAELTQKVQGLRVVKVKIYNLDGLTVFSTQASQIGENKYDNQGFQMARAGGVASEITYRNQFSAFESMIEDRNVLASYIPVRRSLESPVEGVFELYTDVTPFIQEIKATRTRVLGVVISLMLMLYLFLLFYIRKADQMIQQYRRAELQQKQEEIHQAAFYDAVTALPNRSGFEDLLYRTTHKSKTNHSTFAVVMINLDRFKLVNDSLGYEMGNQVLLETAKRLDACTKRDDMVCRIGADEFAIILCSTNTVDDLINIAERIMQRVAEPMLIDGRDVVVNISMGITLYPLDAENDKTLVKYATSALHKAKASGGNRYTFYTDDLNTEITRRFEMEVGLRQALKNDEFEVYYQPRISGKSRKVNGMEALLRWHSPRQGVISPVEFIPVLEETDMIIPVGERVIFEACRQCAEWHRKGFNELKVSINLSAKQFAHKDLVSIIQEALETAELAAHFLELEITESILAHDMDNAIRILKELRELGVYLAIDDFGTGYSSLSYLMHFPVHYLKIDQTFIRDVRTNPDHANLTRAIIAIADSLGLETVAEGVETDEQFGFVTESKCDEIQGFYFSKPVPANQFLAALQEIEGRFSESI